MKLLYAIQGTGNGHVSRARDFIPQLLRHAEVDILISGTSSEVDLGLPVTWRLPGISYTFGKSGGIDYLNTVRNFRPIHFVKDVQLLPVEMYDLVISDFEPVAAWSARRAGVTCVGLSHQAAFLSPNTPRPQQRSLFAETLFQNFAPCTHPIGFHYKRYDSFIYPPVIRKEVRMLRPTSKDRVTVYLPAYAAETLAPLLASVPSVEWHVFSKSCRASWIHKNVTVYPVDSDRYLKSLEGSRGLITGGGFESPSEAIYLDKQLLVVPMKGQYEQACNAEALSRLGVSVLDRVGQDLPLRIEEWLETNEPAGIEFPDHSSDIMEQLLELAGKPAFSSLVG